MLKKFPTALQSPASACTHMPRMWASHTLIPSDPSRVSTALLAIFCNLHQQRGAALLIFHYSSTGDHCPKREADCTHLPPESIEVAGLGLEFQRKTGTGRGTVIDKGFDVVRELGRYKGDLFLFLSLFCSDTLQHFNVRRKGHMRKKEYLSF